MNLRVNGDGEELLHTTESERLISFNRRRTNDFEPVYMTATRRKEMGNQAFASVHSKSRTGKDLVSLKGGEVKPERSYS